MPCSRFWSIPRRWPARSRPAERPVSSSLAAPCDDHRDRERRDPTSSPGHLSVPRAGTLCGRGWSGCESQFPASTQVSFDPPPRRRVHDHASFGGDAGQRDGSHVAHSPMNTKARRSTCRGARVSPSKHGSVDSGTVSCAIQRWGAARSCRAVARELLLSGRGSDDDTLAAVPVDRLDDELRHVDRTCAR